MYYIFAVIKPLNYNNMKNTLSFQEVRQIRLNAFKAFKSNPTIEGKKAFFIARTNQLNYYNN